MNCPACKSALTENYYHGILVDKCNSCQGIWFDHGEIKPYLTHIIKDRPELPEDRLDSQREVVPQNKIYQELKYCPRCQVSMKAINYAYDSNVILDRCPSCKGLWADGGEVLRLATHAKGNPMMGKLAGAIVEAIKDSQDIRDLGTAAREMGGAAVLLPQLVLRSDREEGGSLPPVTILFILANVIILLLVSTMNNPETLLKYCTVVPAHIKTGSGLLGLLGANFLHANWGHLLGNMVFLWAFGQGLEKSLGQLWLIILYLGTGVLTMGLHALRDISSTTPVMGANGAIVGLIGAYLLLHRRGVLTIPLIKQAILVLAHIYLTIWLGMQVAFNFAFLAQASKGGMVWYAHLAGLGIGLVAGAIFRRSRSNEGN